MAKTKKSKKKTGGAKTDFASKKTLKKLAKKVDAMGDEIAAAQQSDHTLGERLDEGLKTLANDLRKFSTGIEAHVNAVKFEASKQVEAAKSEAAREIAAVKADMAKQIEAAKSEATKLAQVVKAETSALLADAGKASDQVAAKLKEELAHARAEVDKALKSAKSGGGQRPAAAARAKATTSKAASKATAPKSPLKRRPATNSGASKDDTNA
jgi:ElaB/YqjD/DUF883 family membrane-anchored ribosome-binding protein